MFRLRVPPEGRRKSRNQNGATGRGRQPMKPGLGAGGGAAIEGVKVFDVYAHGVGGFNEKKRELAGGYV